MPPRVSIVIPCYNEQATIRQLLEAIYHQTYPRAEMEVVIADGLSEDATRAEIAGFQDEHPDLDVRVVDNAARSIPSAVNSAIRAVRGETIVRMDAHSRPYPDYVERCVTALDAGLGDNVGGVWDIKPGGESWVAESIAVAAAHPLGVGDAGYRIGAQASEVDTVPFGAFQRTLVDKIGLLDETLVVWGGEFGRTPMSENCHRLLCALHTAKTSQTILALRLLEIPYVAPLPGYDTLASGVAAAVCRQLDRIDIVALVAARRLAFGDRTRNLWYSSFANRITICAAPAENISIHRTTAFHRYNASGMGRWFPVEHDHVTHGKTKEWLITSLHDCAFARMSIVCCCL